MQPVEFTTADPAMVTRYPNVCLKWCRPSPGEGLREATHPLVDGTDERAAYAAVA